jgi:sulfoxide reductase catalytic subunit YedY
MLIKLPPRSAAKEFEVTPESFYLTRRRFMAASAAVALGGSIAGNAFARSYPDVENAQGPEWFEKNLQNTRWKAVSIDEPLTPFQDATSYNNFYEFGTNKGDPARNAGALQIEPWTVAIDGEVSKPGLYDLSQLLADHQLEERIYRLRCVEAWSMVIPWLGVPLSKLIDRVEPTSNAKYLRMETVIQESAMPGVRSNFALVDWPYVEGLRMDEAVNPLTMLAVGMYGRVLPNQNGAPLRLVVPWKYGFKSIKSIIKISFVSERPRTTWESIAPGEYGFFANVNPEVDHPRWSQARERRLPSGLFSANLRETLMFNGYEEEVASLYSGLDLRANY